MGGRREGRGGKREGKEKEREEEGGTCSKVLGGPDRRPDHMTLISVHHDLRFVSVVHI